MREYVTVWEGNEPLFVGERIVRCRDCRHYDFHGEPSEVYPDRYWCDLLTHYLQPDGFCAWGVRRES